MTTATTKSASEINAEAARECARRGCTFFVVPLKGGAITYHRTMPNKTNGMVWRQTSDGANYAREI